MLRLPRSLTASGIGWQSARVTADAVARCLAPKNWMLTMHPCQHGASIHRWSTDTELSQTTKINVHDRMGGGLDAAELPKSFRDAIWLAKQLEVRYMWIDSICIIQGADSTDWASEAENMAKYYQNSLLTIAATGVEGTNNPGFKFTNGLFPDSPPTFGRRLARLPFRDRDKASTQRGFFYVYPAKHINPEYNSEVLQGLLLRRGWVFQEWLLSRRLISFTPSGVYFDCQTELPTSALGDRLMVSKEDDQYERGFTLKPFIHFGIGGRVEDTWLEIAESYSGLELTFPTKDRLLALSGIATEYIEAVRKAQDNEALPAPNPNLSGLWFQDIHRGLLWQQMDASGIPRQRMDSWMPTWSWTSYMGPISWALFKKPQSISNACRIVGMITSSGAAYPAPHSTQSPTLAAYTPTWKHLLPLPWATKTDQAKYDAIPHLYEAFETHYPLNTEFTHLLVSCQLCTIKVWDCYTKSQLEALSVPTPSTSTTNDADSTGIRKISLVSSSRGRANIRDMCGWASFEDSAFQDQRDFWDGKPIYALHVLTSKASNGWMEQGLLRGWERIYMVIFIRRVDDDGDVYRRIGVGALWGDPVKRGFANAEMQTLQLV
ncbi:heterokaryon incompatibility protein-domain-containing protein [Bombardia bombarda]|uniref:Heterokaryon incompatibility protein-domain-containing protein n=1 Tax=Bombardia bombarda TaxID=252184 RepID=A0AA39XCR4_9PEZI|nr:heterokaryon incompatibility protein-domain-containing protein [Bombardia bombarda]